MYFRYFDGNNCPSLVGKPKVFIIQVCCTDVSLLACTMTCICNLKACRGAKFDYGVDVESTDGPSPTQPKEKDEKEEEEEVHI